MIAMEQNEEQLVFDTKWEGLLRELGNSLGKKPDLQTLLFLIGVQELGQIHRDFTKEEKQDLMHIAVCHLLSLDGYFEYLGRDEEGWPHYDAIKLMPALNEGLEKQEQLLKRQVLKYFDKMH